VGIAIRTLFWGPGGPQNRRVTRPTLSFARGVAPLSGFSSRAHTRARVQKNAKLILANVPVPSIPKNRCRTTIAEPLGKTPAELPFIGDQVSRAGESHPRALAEPDVRLSPHPAPIVQPRPCKSPQWANSHGCHRATRAIQCAVCRRWRRKRTALLDPRGSSRRRLTPGQS